MRRRRDPFGDFLCAVGILCIGGAIIIYVVSQVIR
jgi:hypothetical protein